MPTTGQVTVTEHLLYHQKQSPEATGRFTSLLNDLILAAKIVSREVNKAGLVDILGFTGDINVQGEAVKKLDEYANDIIIHRMERSGAICAMVSEENADVVIVSDKFQRGDYILIFDPLDGSSNIDANVNVGTIFSIHKRISPPIAEPTESDVLQPGYKQIAAGYFLYGTSTMLVYTSGRGVHGFTLDPSVGEFLLSHPDIRIPEQGKIYSVNESYYAYWDAPTRDVIGYFKSFDNPRGKPHSLRYIGSLVADFHRTLLYGGIFMYPMDYRDPKAPRGKLRLMCEASPLAFVAEQAGGLATDGRNRILDIEPTAIHQRVPLFMGSEYDVRKVTELYLQHDGA
ncbi:class 1 fructose-bisphosphatase [Oceanidesulfovibrio marinus]|uniref:Fructose-1,6-bisphosphatase class 1 n=1 Tax=Oceanidesulfovibrio marinus TaxID=370038 RepID=A0A6P1ZK35_9BACT|nr:class 1 fructose-bisphosphatase [Oceanidesulfovibrio marinus]QJT08220.1 class 1 fructose-bisphosphatase [Oceanidesulfovibrio marinus]TVM35115.1 class 1 fructose-bisphosphatase [Oceanidesulfovibrio marinus]